MNLSDLNARMVLGVNRSDLADSGGNYTQFLNDAQREICRMRSWQWMKEKETLTLTAGQTTLELPTNFKEFTSPNSPVHILVQGLEIPVDVWTPEKHKRRVRSLLSTQFACHLDDTVTPKVLNFVEDLTEDADFVVRFYGYLDDLSEDNPSNNLTTDYPDMLLAKAKALAFAAINDPVAADLETYFDLKFKPAAAADAYAQVAGTQLRM
jgi:hypothetical protein